MSDVCIDLACNAPVEGCFPSISKQHRTAEGERNSALALRERFRPTPPQSSCPSVEGDLRPAAT
jgi:hypothetical protein